MTRRLFALERYDPAGELPAPESLARLSGDRTRLVAAFHLPTDDAVLALVEAPDEAAVLAIATEAGWRVDRLLPATWIARTAALEER